MQREDFEGGQILVIQIYENDLEHKPCYIKARGITAGSYKRVDDKDVRLSSTEVYELMNIFRPSAADMEIVPEARQDDLDPQIISVILRNRANSKALHGVRTRAEKLVRLNLVTREGGVRMGGILVAGKYPQQFFPRLFVDVAAHPGIGKGGDGSLRFIDRQSCEGSMAGMISDAVDATARNLRTLSFVEGVGRRDELEIPREVLREAIANAVVHREYSPDFLGQPVSVDIYSDRVEIVSPGGLWGGKTLENIANGTSRCRNGLLMQLMRATSPADESLVEGQGTGVAFMIEEMRKRALQEPHFQAGPDEFRVVLRRLGAEYPQIHEWVLRRAGKDLSREEEAVVLTVRQAGHPVGVKDIHGDLGYDSDDIRADLRDLVGKGIVAANSDGTFAVADRQQEQISADDHRVTTFGGQSGGTGIARQSRRRSAVAVIPEILRGGSAKGSREIAEASGFSLGTVRRALRQLMANGSVQASGEPTSHSRKYEFVEEQKE